MEKIRDSFLDNSVIINFLNYLVRKTELRDKCFRYIEGKQGNLLICLFSLDGIKRYISKREILYTEVLNKRENEKYIIGDNETARKILNNQEILFANKIYETTLSENAKNLQDRFKEEINTIKLNFRIFLKSKVDEMGIKKEEIDSTILSIIYDFIEDFEDCKILTSALQMQQDKEEFFFVTADKHFAPNIYNFIKDDSRFEKYKFPKLKNLLYE